MFRRNEFVSTLRACFERLRSSTRARHRHRLRRISPLARRIAALEALESRLLLAAESEPNDILLQADIFDASSGRLEGQVTSAADVDYWKTDLTQGQSLTILPGSIEFPASNPGQLHYAPAVAIVSDSGVEFAASTDGRPLSFLAPRDDTYFVRISSESAFGDYTGGYQIPAAFSNFGGISEAESNDTANNATPVASSVQLRGTIASSTDRDLFTLEVGAGEGIGVWLSGSPAGRPALRLLDDAGRELAANAEGTGIYAIADAAGTYYLELSSGNAGGTYTGGYAGELVAGAAAVQENLAADLFDGAADWSPAFGLALGNLDSLADIDVFRFQSGALDRWQLHLQSPKDTFFSQNRVLSLYNDLGQLIAYSAYGVLQPGTTYGPQRLSKVGGPLAHAGQGGTFYVAVQATGAAGIGGYALGQTSLEPFPAHRDVPLFYQDYTDQVPHVRNFMHDEPAATFDNPELVDTFVAFFEGRNASYDFDMVTSFPGDGTEYIGYGVQDFTERTTPGGYGEFYGGIRRASGDAILDETGTGWNSLHDLIYGNVLQGMYHEVGHATGSPHIRHVLDFMAYDQQTSVQTIGTRAFFPFTDSRVPGVELRNERDAWDWNLQAGRYISESEPNNTSTTALDVTPYLQEMQIDFHNRSFATNSSQFESQFPHQLRTADFNNDGNVDLAAASQENNNVAIMLGDGAGNFTVNLHLGADEDQWWTEPLAVADFNRDGNEDVAISGTSLNRIWLHPGNGDGTFGNATAIGIGAAPQAVEAADVDKDQNPDLIVAAGNNEVRVLFGNGDLSFQSPVGYPVGAGPLSLTVDDFDGNGWMDVASANSNAGGISVLLNQANGTFAEDVQYETGAQPHAIVSAHLVGGAATDLAVFNAESQTVSVLAGQGDGTFINESELEVPAVGYSLDAADMNDDSRQDLIVSDYTGEVLLMLGRGDGSFREPIRYSTNGGIRSDTRGLGDSGTVGVLVAALTDDGRPDIAAANGLENRISVLVAQENDARNDRAVVTGRITSRADLDLFRLQAEAGQTWTFDIDSAEFQQPLDPRLQLLDSGGSVIAENNDALDRDSGLDSVDPFLTHSFAAAGEYLVAVSGVSGSVGSYRLKLTPEEARDDAGPRVIASLPDGQSTVDSTRQLRFWLNDLLDPATLTSSSIIVEGAAGEVRAGSVRFDPLDATLLWTADEALPPDTYTVTFKSGSGGITDLVGNQLDGETDGALDWPELSGNGTPGGDFVTSFTVNSTDNQAAWLWRSEARQNPYNRSHILLSFADEMLALEAYQPDIVLRGAGPDRQFGTADDRLPAIDFEFDKNLASLGPRIDIYSRGVLDQDIYRVEATLQDAAGHEVAISHVISGLDLSVSGDAIRVSDATFAVDLPNGQYNVLMGLGDPLLDHDFMDITLEGFPWNGHFSRAGIPNQTVWSGMNVNDGRLTLRLQDRGGTDANAAIYSLRIEATDGSTTRSFDFSTATSPAATGFDNVKPDSNYSAAQGFGWTAGTVTGSAAIDEQDACATWTRDWFSGTVSPLRHGISVVDANLQPGATLAAAPSELAIQFSGQIDENSLTDDNYRIRYSSNPTFFDQDDVFLSESDRSIAWQDTTYTATFDPAEELANGYYLFELTSGPQGLQDACGRPLDGEFLDSAIHGSTRSDLWHDQPSGDGIAGGEYRASFTVSATQEQLGIEINRAAISEADGMSAATATVSRSGPKDLPLVVQVAVSDETEATARQTVTILPGSDSATFPIHAIDDLLLDGTISIEVTVSALAPRYDPATAMLDVTDHETLTVTIDPDTISENAGTATGIVTRSNTGGLSEQLVVDLASSNTTGGATVDAQVTIPQNEAAATFTIEAVDDALLDGMQTVSITASADGYVSGNDSLDVTDHETLTVTIDPDTISENAGTATGTVTRSNTGGLSEQLVVDLASSNTTGGATVDAQVTIPQNEAAATFTIEAVDDVLLDGTQTVSITASASGYFGDEDSLVVTDYETLTIVIVADTISENGGSTTATVTRSNTDIGTALVVNLSNGDSSKISIPTTVTIPANQASASFNVDAVDDDLLNGLQTVSITASADGYFEDDDTLVVTDHERIVILIAADTISERAGTSATTVTVTRTNTDIGSELIVNLTNGDPTEINTPATVTIPAGDASASFNIDAVEDGLSDGTQVVTVMASANGYVAGSDTLEVTGNQPPVLATIGNKSVDEGSLLTFTASATDVDVPANTLTFSLDAGAPAGAGIDANSGAFTWTPTEVQGPGTFDVTVRVTDDGTPNLYDFETIEVTVGEVNEPPVLAAIGNKSVDEGSLLTFTASATDVDVPANTLTFSLDADAPAGASIHPTTGVFTWTPSEAQGPGTFNITVRVTDDGTPKLNDFETIEVTVGEVNEPPVLASIGNKSVDEGSLLTFTASATDVDVPANTLTFSLDAGAPAGAGIDANSGAFTWTPSEAQGPGAFDVTVRVTDDGTPNLNDFETIAVTVGEVNEPPVLASIGNKSVDEGSLLTFTASATDVDVPANTLTFSLDAGAPSGANIDPNSGLFTWTPTEAQGPASYNITVRVTDNGTPVQASAMVLAVQMHDDKPWQYFAEPLDVNVDGFVSPLDALIIINDINAQGPRALASPTIAPEFYLDVNGDGSISPVDALIIVNHLNQGAAGPEAECAECVNGRTEVQSSSPRGLVQVVRSMDASHSVRPNDKTSSLDDPLQAAANRRVVFPAHSFIAEQSGLVSARGFRELTARNTRSTDLEVLLELLARDVASALLGPSGDGRWSSR